MYKDVYIHIYIYVFEYFMWSVHLCQECSFTADLKNILEKKNQRMVNYAVFSA